MPGTGAHALQRGTKPEEVSEAQNKQWQRGFMTVSPTNQINGHGAFSFNANMVTTLSCPKILERACFEFDVALMPQI